MHLPSTVKGHIELIWFPKGLPNKDINQTNRKFFQIEEIAQLTKQGLQMRSLKKPLCFSEIVEGE